MNEKTSDYVVAATLGIMVGVIHGLSLWATMHTGVLINEGGLGINTGSIDGKTAILIPVSYFLYSNGTTLPLIVAGISDAIGLSVVLSSGLWINKATNFIETLGSEIGELQMQEKEDQLLAEQEGDDDE